jgi:hypothetical protein
MFMRTFSCFCLALCLSSTAFAANDPVLAKMVALTKQYQKTKGSGPAGYTFMGWQSDATYVECGLIPTGANSSNLETAIKNRAIAGFKAAAGNAKFDQFVSQVAGKPVTFTSIVQRLAGVSTSNTQRADLPGKGAVFCARAQKVF